MTIASRASELVTKRLLMRRVRAGDLGAVHAIMSDPDVMRIWSTLPHTNLAETERWLCSMLAADAAQESDEFIIERNGIVIGKIGVWRPPELGFFLRRDCWGQGSGSEALERYICYARIRGFDRLTADVDLGNVACLGLLAKYGLIETGRWAATCVVAGPPCDSVYLNLDLSVDF
jgi:RimJ/RimL family protein N-acetyltransferase